MKVDLGASWVGVNQPNLLQLVDELRLRLIPQFETGDNIIELANGRIVRWNGSLSESVATSGMSVRTFPYELKAPCVANILIYAY